MSYFVNCDYCFNTFTISNNNSEPFFQHMDHCRVIHGQYLYECEHIGCSYKTNSSIDIDSHDGICSFKPKLRLVED